MLTPDARPDGARISTPPLPWIDAARTAGIIAVIAIHVVAPLLANRGLPESWWFGNIVDSAARWAVPLFVMISGALLLHSGLADDPRRFYQRRLSRILPPLVVWTAIYLAFGHLTANNPQTLKDAALAVLAGRPYYHLPFLYLITGLYVVAPFLRPLAAQVERESLRIAVVAFMALGVIDTLTVVWGRTGGANAATLFVPYVGYFLAGAWLVEVPPTRGRIVAAVAVAAMAILATAVGTDILMARLGLSRGLYLYEYLSVTTVPASLAVFALFVWSAPAIARLAARVPGRAASVVAASTLGIYVIHPLVIRGLGVIGLGPRSLFVPLAVLATAIATFAISLGIVLFLRSLPIIRRIV